MIKKPLTIADSAGLGSGVIADAHEQNHAVAGSDSIDKGAVQNHLRTALRHSGSSIINLGKGRSLYAIFIDSNMRLLGYPADKSSRISDSRKIRRLAKSSANT